MQGTEDRQATSPGRGRLRAPLGRVRPSAGLPRPPWKLLPVRSRSHAELPQAWRPRPSPGQAGRHARGVTTARARRPACRAGGPGGPARSGRRERGGRPGVAPGDGGRQGPGPQPGQGHARAREGAGGAGGGRGGVQLSRSPARVVGRVLGFPPVPQGSALSGWNNLTFRSWTVVRSLP